MTHPDNTIKIEEEGFITTKKGLTLSTISLFIWILTGIVYKLSSLFIPNINYESFCFVTSLLLSILFGLFLIKLLVKNADMLSKIVLGIANILLLYTSANGIQSGYSFMSRPDDVSESASLIPFIEARPWLPDNYQASIIDSLEEENLALTEMVAELKESRPDYDELLSQREENQILRENLNSLNEIIQGLRSDIQSLEAENSRLKESRTAADKELLSQIESLKRENQSLADKLKQCTDAEEKLKVELERLKRENAITKNEYGNLNIKLEAANAELNKLRRENRSLSQRLEACMEELNQLKRRYQID